MVMRCSKPVLRRSEQTGGELGVGRRGRRGGERSPPSAGRRRRRPGERRAARGWRRRSRRSGSADSWERSVAAGAAPRTCRRAGPPIKSTARTSTTLRSSPALDCGNGGGHRLSVWSRSTTTSTSYRPGGASGCLQRGKRLIWSPSALMRVAQRVPSASRRTTSAGIMARAGASGRNGNAARASGGGAAGSVSRDVDGVERGG